MRERLEKMLMDQDQNSGMLRRILISIVRVGIQDLSLIYTRITAGSLVEELQQPPQAVEDTLVVLETMVSYLSDRLDARLICRLRPASFKLTLRLEPAPQRVLLLSTTQTKHRIPLLLLRNLCRSRQCRSTWSESLVLPVSDLEPARGI